MRNKRNISHDLCNNDKNLYIVSVGDTRHHKCFALMKLDMVCRQAYPSQYCVYDVLYSSLAALGIYPKFYDRDEQKMKFIGFVVLSAKR